MGIIRKGLFMKKGKKPAKTAEEKARDFIRVVTPRVKKALKAIRLIGNQSGSAYKYTDEQVANIITALRLEVNAVEKRYQGTGSQDIDFTLE